MADAVLPLLRQLYDGGATADRHAAEAQLGRFAATDEGLSWALNSLAACQLDGQALFVAATVAELAATRRWHRLPPPQRAALQACLWGGATSPPAAQPAYVTGKLTAALAHVACVEWQPRFWEELGGCLGDGGRVQAGLRLLDATLDQLHGLAQTTSMGLRGKVRNAL